MTPTYAKMTGEFRWLVGEPLGRKEMDTYFVLMRNDWRHLPTRDLDLIFRYIISGPGAWVQAMVCSMRSVELPTPGFQHRPRGFMGREHLLVHCPSLFSYADNKL